MGIEIYQAEQWRDFFLLVGTGAVTLTGLVFVAMSLNLKTIAIDATHRYRAIGTLTGLALVFMRCALALMGGQEYKAVGIELLVIAGVAAYVYINGYVQAYRAGSLSRNLRRTTTGTALYIIEMIGAALLIFGHKPGIYIAASAMVVNTCYMITGAWLLVMGVFKSPK
jgi:hypothetical protein